MALSQGITKLTLYDGRERFTLDAQVRSFIVTDDGEIPNNPVFPVLVYKGVFGDRVEDMEPSFNRHDWTNSWTGDVYDYHHYHATTHEVLGVKSGQATMLIGGEAGERVELKTGDVIVLPAGTGHKKLDGTNDFEVVGAYSGGKHPDVRKKDPSARAQALSQISKVPAPPTDPVFGENGPLNKEWNS